MLTRISITVHSAVAVAGLIDRWIVPIERVKGFSKPSYHLQQMVLGWAWLETVRAVATTFGRLFHLTLQMVAKGRKNQFVIMHTPCVRYGLTS